MKKYELLIRIFCESDFLIRQSEIKEEWEDFIYLGIHLNTFWALSVKAVSKDIPDLNNIELGL